MSSTSTETWTPSPVVDLYTGGTEHALFVVNPHAPTTDVAAYIERARRDGRAIRAAKLAVSAAIVALAVAALWLVQVVFTFHWASLVFLTLAAAIGARELAKLALGFFVGVLVPPAGLLSPRPLPYVSTRELERLKFGSEDHRELWHLVELSDAIADLKAERRQWDRQGVSTELRAEGDARLTALTAEHDALHVRVLARSGWHRPATPDERARAFLDALPVTAS